MPTLYNGFGALLILACIVGILLCCMAEAVENQGKEQ